MQVTQMNCTVQFIINYLRLNWFGQCKNRISGCSSCAKRSQTGRGIAVIAHPGQLKDISLLEQLADRKEIDGIEVWHQAMKNLW